MRHGIPITTVLGNDASWGIDRQIQLQVYGKPVATDLLPVRYDRLVESLGGVGLNVRDPADLPNALDRALNSGRPSLVNIEVQRAISPRGQAAVDRWKSTVPSAVLGRRYPLDSVEYLSCANATVNSPV